MPSSQKATSFALAAIIGALLILTPQKYDSSSTTISRQKAIIIFFNPADA